MQDQVQENQQKHQHVMLVRRTKYLMLVARNEQQQELLWQKKAAQEGSQGQAPWIQGSQGPSPHSTSVTLH